MRHRGILRAGLLVLALPSVVLGVWITIAPRSFYDDFPGGGRHWVSALPPYNEHLLRDFGSANLTIAIVLIGAAIVLESRFVQVTLLAYIVGTLAHLGYHLTTTGHYSSGDNIASLGGFAVELLLAVALLVLTRQLARASEAPPPAASSHSPTSRS
ncbi:MAG TPA: hypothetical protein VKG89_09785 [Solirubrobacterales bacterium]|nr:hypothetical protein [Solirubrobacterales bacterium]